jgi:hypothetical protein
MNKLRYLLDNPEYAIVGICISFGAVAHTLEEIRKGKWGGWMWMFSETGVCLFTGFVFYQIAQLTFPEYTYIYCSLGSFWGTKGFKYIYEWFIESLKVVTKEKNDRK